jgi:hypothetical protein
MPSFNSQLDVMHRIRQENWPDCPVRVARYTGQERDADREAIINDPPHILLTNYVMLEYMLVRPYERVLVQQATQELHFLVMDELHVYRGRQGADVAMLLRRVRQRANRDLQVIGTSATLATQGNREERRERIAQAASTLFGVTVPPASVIDESLQRVATVPAPRTTAELRAAVRMAPPEPSLEAVTAHPLAAWLEERFGLDEEDGRLVRRAPLTFVEGLRRLVEVTGLDEDLCRELKDLANQDLVEARLHSVWLAAVGLRLGASMVDVLDLDMPDCPVMADKAAQLELPDRRGSAVPLDDVQGHCPYCASWKMMPRL